MILSLEKDIVHTLEEVSRVQTVHDSSGGTHYNLQLGLSYSKNGVKRLKNEEINLQFATDLHIGAQWLNDKELKPNNWQEVRIASSAFKSVDNRSKNDSKVLAVEYNCVYRSESEDEETLPKRIREFKCDPPLEIGGKLIHFIIVPCFEIARFFFFDSNNYNELLLKSDLKGRPEDNLIFNPKRSCLIKGKNITEVRHVQLRKGVEDSSAYIAANLAFNKGFINQVSFLKGVIEGSLGFFNGSSFFGMRLPITAFNELITLSDFVKNKNGEDGLRVNVITDIVQEDCKYTFRRDNDGRSVAEESEDLPKINGKKKKNLNKHKPKKDSINHQESADDDFDTVPLDRKSELSRYRIHRKADKLEKLDQKTRARIATELKNKPPKGYSGQGSEGGSGSEHQGVDNSSQDTAFITDEKYWSNFHKIIREIKKQWHEAEIEYWVSSEKKFKYFKSPETCFLDMRNSIPECYFMKVKVGDNYAYILECNQTDINKNTLIFQSRDREEINVKTVRKILKKIRNGKTLKVLRNKHNLRTNGVVHRKQNKGKDGKPGKLIKTDEAIQQFSERIIKYLKPMIG